MFDLFIPYLIGVALGISPQDDPAPEIAPLEFSQGSGDDITARAPEPQVPTGKYTTAVEVKPILGVTKANWVAVRLYEGQDLLYFTHLLAWRCGLWDVLYGINGAPPETDFVLEPCHDELAMPNSIVDVIDYLPYITLPPDSVDSVTIELTFDDGTTDTASFARGDILIP